jgi:hypothetical protein
VGSFSSSSRMEALGLQLGLYPSLGLDSNMSVDDAERQHRSHPGGTAAAVAAAVAGPSGRGALAAGSSSRTGDQDVLRLPADVHHMRDDSASEQQRHSQQQRVTGGEAAPSQVNVHHSSSGYKDTGTCTTAVPLQQQQQYAEDPQAANHSPLPCWLPSGQQQSHSAPLSGRSSSGAPSLVHDWGTGTMSAQVSTYSSTERQQSHEGSSHTKAAVTRRQQSHEGSSHTKAAVTRRQRQQALERSAALTHAQ